ncbi:MAG: bifunctional riboflavin kinase/FAD synthetase [Terricaulis sp.]
MQRFEPSEQIPNGAKNASIALGNFDGVHLGHLAVIAAAEDAAKANGWALGAAVFSPHPRRVLLPDAPPFQLQTNGQRARALKAAGVQLQYVIGFDRALSQLSDREFVAQIIAGRLGAKHVSVGADFCFGRGRSGNVETLTRLGEEFGFGVTAIAPVGGAEKYGSSAIRKAIAAGDLSKANGELGRPWAIEGEVRKGFQRGREFGYRTANVGLGDYVRPRLGIYAVQARVGDAAYQGVASIGVNPTVGALPEPLLEAHLFDFDADIYGQTIEVEMIAFLRDEAKFETADALVRQIAEDAAAARDLLKGV